MVSAPTVERPVHNCRTIAKVGRVAPRAPFAADGSSRSCRQHALGCSRSSASVRATAFTLIELLLVMTIMVTAMAIAAPTLANFFRGRTLDSEARRLLALTHSGQNRAVSEGIPARLWVDAAQHSYGLQQDPGWSDRDPKALEFACDKELEIEVVHAEVSRSKSARNRVPTNAQAQANPRGLPEIRFMPDGTIDETSPRAVHLQDRSGTSLWLAMATNRLSYEIRTTFN
jgi:type II secretion system protein H